jgi:hypothetical protein
MLVGALLMAIGIAMIATGICLGKVLKSIKDEDED